jgi:hypothetical protein
MRAIAAALNPPGITTYLVIGVASFMAVAFVVRFWLASRNTSTHHINPPHQQEQSHGNLEQDQVRRRRGRRRLD